MTDEYIDLGKIIKKKNNQRSLFEQKDDLDDFIFEMKACSSELSYMIECYFQNEDGPIVLNKEQKEFCRLLQNAGSYTFFDNPRRFGTTTLLLADIVRRSLYLDPGSNFAFMTHSQPMCVMANEMISTMFRSLPTHMTNPIFRHTKTEIQVMGAGGRTQSSIFFVPFVDAVYKVKGLSLDYVYVDVDKECNISQPKIQESFDCWIPCLRSGNGKLISSLKP